MMDGKYVPGAPDEDAGAALGADEVELCEGAEGGQRLCRAVDGEGEGDRGGGRGVGQKGLERGGALGEAGAHGEGHHRVLGLDLRARAGRLEGHVEERHLHAARGGRRVGEVGGGAHHLHLHGALLGLEALGGLWGGWGEGLLWVCLF